MRLFSNRWQKTSKCGKNISDTLGFASCATFLFLPHFDVICDLLLNRRTATWNLFVKYFARSENFARADLDQCKRIYNFMSCDSLFYAFYKSFIHLDSMEGSTVLTSNNKLISWKCSVSQSTPTSISGRGKDAREIKTSLSKGCPITEGLDDKMGRDFLNYEHLSTLWTTDERMAKMLTIKLLTSYVKTWLFWLTAVTCKPHSPSRHRDGFLTASCQTDWLARKRPQHVTVRDGLQMILKYVCLFTIAFK